MTLPAGSTGAAGKLPDAGTDNEQIAATAKALGHPARVAIVQLLLAKPSCIGYDIVEEVGLAQSTVSEHLRILKAAGVITGTLERPRICYSLNPGALEPLAALLNAAFAKAGREELSGAGCCGPQETANRKNPREATS